MKIYVINGPEGSRGFRFEIEAHEEPGTALKSIREEELRVIDTYFVEEAKGKMMSFLDLTRPGGFLSDEVDEGFNRFVEAVIEASYRAGLSASGGVTR